MGLDLAHFLAHPNLTAGLTADRRNDMHEHEDGVEVLTIDEMLDGLEAVTEEWLTQGTDAGVAYWMGHVQGIFGFAGRYLTDEQRERVGLLVERVQEDFRARRIKLKPDTID
jgi:hypothetical protein